MSEVKKPREWWIEFWNKEDNENELYRRYVSAIKFEPMPTTNKIVHVIEKFAFDKAIMALKEADKLIEDNFFGRDVEITDFIQWRRELRELLKELGCE